MYNDKTTFALKAIIKVCYVGLAVGAIGLIALGFLRSDGVSLINGAEKKYFTFLFSFLFQLPAGYAALVLVDKLLNIVQRDMVFENKTVKYLDSVSYCCFYAGIISVITIVASLIERIDTFMLWFFILALGEMFMALLLKVIKKIFSKAIELKEENDLTI